MTEEITFHLHKNHFNYRLVLANCYHINIFGNVNYLQLCSVESTLDIMIEIERGLNIYLMKLLYQHLLSVNLRFTSHDKCKVSIVYQN